MWVKVCAIHLFTEKEWFIANERYQKKQCNKQTTKQKSVKYNSKHTLPISFNIFRIKENDNTHYLLDCYICYMLQCKPIYRFYLSFNKNKTVQSLCFWPKNDSTNNFVGNSVCVNS